MTSQPQAGRPSSQRSWPVPASLTYEFRVEGHLDDHWSAWLGDLTIARHHDGTSTLTGPVATRPSSTACSPGYATSAPH